MERILAVDFDGTIVEHVYPDIGKPVPNAIEWLHKFNNMGIKLMLWTMRSGQTLDGAEKYCEENKIILWGVNQSMGQEIWTSSPKQYAHAYIDDSAIGCPLRESSRYNGRPMVDWEIAGPLILQKFELF